MKFLIVYGPTREAIDPVRYLSNYSTGTMGRCLVDAAKKRNHRVTAVVCPQDAESAQDLLGLMKKKVPDCDVLIMAAAVCDSRPVSVSRMKIKKERLSSIQLTANPDILKTLGKLKKKHQRFIGFALESEDMMKNAEEKRLKKNLDLIVLQRVIEKNAPFGDKRINAWILGSDRGVKSLKNVSKHKLAECVIEEAQRALKIA